MVKPSKFDQHMREASALFPGSHDLIDGFRFGVAKSVSQSATHDFSVTHGLQLTSNPRAPSEYSFGATYLRQNSMLMARADTNGVVLAQAKLPIDTDLSLEAVYQGMGGNDFTAAELEWKGVDFVATAKTNSQGTVGISYFQQLHSKLAAGVSGEYHTEERRSRLSWAARFEPTADQIVTAEVTPKAEKGFSAQTSYYCKVGDQLAMGATLALLPGKRVADLTFGYDYTLLSGGRFRGMIGSDGKVTGLLEEKLNPITTFALSAELNHAKHEYKFGFGLTFGQM